jgi:hypothetical protein
MADSHTALIFAPSQTATANAVARVISDDPRLADGACRVCVDVASVHAALKYLAHRPCIIILLAGCQAELDQMLSLVEWFEDFPLILMQPDDRSDTFAKAHRLRPRYLMGPRIDFAELRTVVSNLLGRQQQARSCGGHRSRLVLIALDGCQQGYFRLQRTAPAMTAAKGIGAWGHTLTNKSRK